MNKFILSGNLTADPVFHPGQDESKNRCNFRIAHNHTKDKATFFSCTAWGKAAERVSKLTKGKRVLVEGDIEESEWTDSQTQQKMRDKQVNVRNIDYIDFPDQQNQPPAPAPHQAAPTGYTPPPGYGQQPAPQAPPQQQPQYTRDAAGNTYQAINGQWVMVQQAPTAPPVQQRPPAPAPQQPPQFQQPQQGFGQPFNTNEIPF